MCRCPDRKVGTFTHSVDKIIMAAAQKAADGRLHLQHIGHRPRQNALLWVDLDQVLFAEISAVSDFPVFGRIEKEINGASSFQKHLKGIIKGRQSAESAVIHTMQDGINGRIVRPHI